MKTIINTSLITGNNPATMRIEKNEYTPATQIESEHAYAMPVIHIDYRGRILYANRASFQLLGEWNCIANEYLPEKLVMQYPGLLNLDADFQLTILVKSFQFHLDAIGFKESGYIGLYGFRTETNNEIHDPVASYEVFGEGE
ncbi:MAG: hypothetical protein ABI763_00540 [Bacteroidota bacterium]